jgi:hypothetical protein
MERPLSLVVSLKKSSHFPPVLAAVATRWPLVAAWHECEDTLTAHGGVTTSLHGGHEGRQTRAIRSKRGWDTLTVGVTSLVLTCFQNVEFQKLELKWSARKSNKIVFLFLSPKFVDLILASNMLLGLMTC